MSTLTRTDAPSPAAVRDAARAFQSAHALAELARGGLTRKQEAGYAALPPDAEALIDEAEYRHQEFLRLVGLDEIVSSILTAEFGEDVSADYADRRPPRVVDKTGPLAGDWRESVGRVDWTRGAAA